MAIWATPMSVALAMTALWFVVVPALVVGVLHYFAHHRKRQKNTTAASRGLATEDGVLASATVTDDARDANEESSNDEWR